MHIAAEFAGTSAAITGDSTKIHRTKESLRAEERRLQQKLEDASKRQGLVKYQDTCAASEEVLIESALLLPLAAEGACWQEEKEVHHIMTKT